MVVNSHCEAKFNKLIAGNPQMIKYKAWVNSFFDSLYEKYDWEICDRDMKDYMETEAYYIIMKKFNEVKAN